jgi:hypothetical protein
MYTLKIKWFRYEKDEDYAKEHPKASPQFKLADENTLFIPAEIVTVGSEVKSLDEMKAWESGSYLNYSMPFMDDDTEQKLMKGTRLIQVIKDNKDTWYLASNAWLLGPEGKTIERLTS